MRNLITTASVFVLAGLAAAQNTQFTLPTPPAQNSLNNIPFSAGTGRYQQWFAASEVQSQISEPQRFIQLQVFAGGGQQVNTTLDLEVVMGNGSSLGLTGAFDASFVSNRTVVFPRAVVNLVAVPAGSPALTFNFANQFTWDGQSPIVVEVKVFGNGRPSNAPFNYDMLAKTTAVNKMIRQYALGAPTQTFATSVQQGWGLSMRFTSRSGAVVAFGQGCPGQGNVVPLYTSPLVWPSLNWTGLLGNAPPQRSAMFVLGDSNTMWGTTPLPLDLGPALGANGCSLYASALVTTWTMTVGGGPGTGTASMSMVIPPIPQIIGTSWYSQWLVQDPLAPNGVGAASNALRHIIAPVGG